MIFSLFTITHTYCNYWFKWYSYNIIKKCIIDHHFFKFITHRFSLIMTKNNMCSRNLEIPPRFRPLIQLLFLYAPIYTSETRIDWSFRESNFYYWVFENIQAGVIITTIHNRTIEDQLSKITQDAVHSYQRHK